MKRFRHGWRKDKVDQRDFLYRKIAKPRLEPLPDSVDLRAKCSPVEDQGDLGSCTAHALAGAMEFLNPSIRFSRLFIYYQERFLEGAVDQDNGAQIRDGVKSLYQFGDCPETDWPYDVSQFTVQPLARCYSDAAFHKIQSYHRLLSIKDMLTCLADGYPFAFGISVFDSFESEDANKTGVIPMPGPSEQNLGGHALLCVGYKRETKQFIFKNSWSTSWGDQGFGYLDFDYMEQFGDDQWVLIS